MPHNQRHMSPEQQAALQRFLASPEYGSAIRDLPINWEHVMSRIFDFGSSVLSASGGVGDGFNLGSGVFNPSYNNQSNTNFWNSFNPTRSEGTGRSTPGSSNSSSYWSQDDQNNLSFELDLLLQQRPDIFGTGYGNEEYDWGRPGAGNQPVFNGGGGGGGNGSSYYPPDSNPTFPTDNNGGNPNPNQGFYDLLDTLFAVAGLFDNNGVNRDELVTWPRTGMQIGPGPYYDNLWGLNTSPGWNPNNPNPGGGGGRPGGGGGGGNGGWGGWGTGTSPGWPNSGGGGGGGSGGGGGGGGGWGGGGGGGGTDWLNLGLNAVNALGLGGGGGGGRRKPRSGRIASNIAGQVFDRQGRRDVTDFLRNRLPLSGAENAAIGYFDTLGSELGGVVPRTNELLGTLNRGLTDIVQGDFNPTPPNIDPAIALANRQWQRLTMPQMASTFAGNLFSTDYDNARRNAATDVSTNLGALSLDLTEKAKDRALQGIATGYSSGLEAQASPIINGVRAGSALLGAGQAGRTLQESVRPGAAPPVPSLLDSLTSLSGVESSTGFPQNPNYQAGGLGLAGLLSQPGGTGTGGPSGNDGPPIIWNFNNLSGSGDLFNSSAPPRTTNSYFNDNDDLFSTTGLRVG